MTMFHQKTKAVLQELLHEQATWREIINNAEDVAYQAGISTEKKNPVEKVHMAIVAKKTEAKRLPAQKV